jgi:exopolysaccharide biosynthesis polyprenyl glycosylphosphotransferase
MMISVIFKLFTDSLAFLGSLLVILILRNEYIETYQFGGDLDPLYFGYIIFILFIYSSGGYGKSNELTRISNLVAITRGSLYANLSFVVIIFLTKVDFPRSIIIASYIILPIFTVLGRIIANYLARLVPGLNETSNILVYGAGKIGQEFISMISQLDTSYNMVGFLDDKLESNDVLDSYDKLEEIAASKKVDRLIVAISDVSDGRISEIQSAGRKLGIQVSFIPSPSIMRNNLLKYKDFAGITVVTNPASSTTSLFRLSKRIFDIIISLILLALSLPLWIFIGIAIKYDDRGPVLFSQKRVGLKGNEFKMYKFRSMHLDSNKYSHCPTDSDDPRITKTGQWLRKYSLDELPQMINVLLGNMSLVGPRPEMPFIVSLYNNFEKQRLSVKPGVTGLWQISPGRKHEITDNLEYDIYYIQNQSITLDLILLLLTGIFVFRAVTH